MGVGDKMFCKYCGKEIPNDAVFCNYCGKNVKDKDLDKKDLNEKVENKNNAEKIEQKKPKKTYKSYRLVAVIIIAIAGFICIIFNGAQSSNNTNSPGINIISRNLRSDDYYCQTSQGLTSYSLTITPKLNIDECTIELRLYNSKNQKIFSDTISKYNLKKGSSYLYTFDFGFVNSLSGNYVEYNITGKC